MQSEPSVPSKRSHRTVADLKPSEFAKLATKAMANQLSAYALVLFIWLGLFTAGMHSPEAFAAAAAWAFLCAAVLFFLCLFNMDLGRTRKLDAWPIDNAQKRQPPPSVAPASPPPAKKPPKPEATRPPLPEGYSSARDPRFDRKE